MMEEGDELVAEKEFQFEGEIYRARLYFPQEKRQNLPYGEIVYKSTGMRPRNMRDIARRFLRPYGIVVPYEAHKLVTHRAIEKLMEFI